MIKALKVQPPSWGYTTRLQKGGAMIEEMRQLVRAWTDAPAGSQRELAVRANVLNKGTRARAADVLRRAFAGFPSWTTALSSTERPNLLPSWKKLRLDKILERLAESKYDWPKTPMRYWPPHPKLRDPDDELILELAVANRSQFILIWNTRDCEGASEFGIEVLTPGQFLKRLGEGI